MRKVFLLINGENPIVIKTLPVTFSDTEVENHFHWEIPLPEHEVTLHCFYPTTPKKQLLEKLTETAKKYMQGEV